MRDLFLAISGLFDLGWLALLAVEVVWLLLRARVSRERLGEVAANVSVAIPFFTVGALTAGATIALTTTVAGWVPWSLPITPVTALMALWLRYPVAVTSRI